MPVGSVAALPSGCQLRNDIGLGGWVIWARPDVPVSADGRNDLFGLDGYAQVRWFVSASGAAEAPAQLADEHTTCVLAVDGSPLVPALEQAGWREVGRDGVGVALVAPGT